jgi:hypothetical protein
LDPAPCPFVEPAEEPGKRPGSKLAQAEAQDQKPNPVEMLRQLHDSGQSLEPEKAEAYLAQVYEDRKHWKGE